MGDKYTFDYRDNGRYESFGDFVAANKVLKPSQTFYILWNPDSYKPPTVEFSSREEAERVAESMAREHGGTFYVMKCVAKKTRVVTIKSEHVSY